MGMKYIPCIYPLGFVRGAGGRTGWIHGLTSKNYHYLRCLTPRKLPSATGYSQHYLFVYKPVMVAVVDVSCVQFHS